MRAWATEASRPAGAPSVAVSSSTACIDGQVVVTYTDGTSQPATAGPVRPSSTNPGGTP